MNYLSIDVLPYANVEIIVADPLDGCLGADTSNFGAAVNQADFTGNFILCMKTLTVRSNSVW